MERFSDKVLIKIAQIQLGREAENIYQVIVVCSYGYPVVVKSLPLKDNKPFPTLHYLTCPFLRKEISKLEEKGLVKVLEEKIQTNLEFKKQLFSAHEKVKKERAELLTKEFGNTIWKEVLNKVGTGGLKDWTKVKCLHLHTADFLAGINNPVGKEVINLLKKIECENIYCRRLIQEDLM
ncbi:DUF501 domain-containing protein [Thermosipho ferrireducens]|uniref:DUF501 domain-containing protein n=1 Tax=Thermosipho ferrireducens TaxID=2571116 RepID=A0ABX7S7P7_9BACT|nr:DUF501 domain-containing protein [Thermosipho ferrireducens]QTA37306.1 DUF501 domain-containing protein [Thermosipho ferrireducens]